MSTHHIGSEEDELALSIRVVTDRFGGRRLNDEVVQELAKALNSELASWLDGRRIHLGWDGSTIRVDVSSEVKVAPTSEQGATAALVGFDAVAAALAA